MANAEFDVICAGAVNLDTIVVVDRAPLDDERMTSDTFVNAGGGPAATAAVALARLGARVGICAVVGDDREGEIVRAMLEDENVDTRWMRVDPHAQTARAVILASRATGGRSIVTTVAPEPLPQEVPIGASTWLHVDQTGYRSTREALRSAAAGGAHSRPGLSLPGLSLPGLPRLSIDAGNPIPGLDLDGTALFAPTLGTLLARYQTDDRGSALEAARSEGAQQVVATDGANGTYVLTDDGVEWVDSYDVEVASTLGAGDVFHGALLAGIVRGESLIDATRGANAAAALACTRVDGRSGIPTLPQLQAFMKEQTP